MNSTIKRGQLAMARFRPDNVGTVGRVYGRKCDLHRVARPTLHGVPTKALTPVGEDVTLYCIAVCAFGTMWPEAIVAGAEGAESWCRHNADRVPRAHICVVDRTMQQASDYAPIADLLITDQTEQPQAA